MSVILGSGEQCYKVMESWAKLPDGWEFRDVGAVALDSRGDIYVGEVSYTDWPTTHPDVPLPKGLRSLQKLQKVN